MQKVKKTGKYDFSLIALYAFLIPFDQKVSTVMLMLLILEKLYNWKRIKFETSFKLLLPAFIYIFLIISLMYSLNYDSKYYIRKLQLIVFPILFSFNNKNLTQKSTEVILRSFAIGCVLSVLFCEVYSFYRACTFYPGGFYAIVQPGHDLFRSISEGGNLFFGQYFSVFHQTMYYAVFLLFSLVILIHKPFVNKKVQCVSVVMILLGLFQVSNRASFLVMGVLLVFFILKKWSVISKSKKVMTGFVLVVFVVSISMNPRFNTVVVSFFKTGVKINPKATSTYEVRMLTWDASIEIIYDNFLLGVGIADQGSELMREYEELGYVVPFESKLNSHNQYLTITIQIGFIGLLLIIMSHYYLFKEERLMFSGIRKSLVIIFLVSFLFESMLERYSGLLFFSFFYSLLVSKQSIKVN